MKKVDFGRTIENLQRMIEFGNLTGIQRATCADALLLIDGMLGQLAETKPCNLCAKYDICDPDAEEDSQEYDAWLQCYAGSRLSSKCWKAGWIWKGVGFDD